MVALIVIVAIVVLLLLSAMVSYNRFISGRNAVQNAWADVDTELKRRYDLVPNLVNTVQGYAAHERGVFEEVTRARASAQSAQGPAQASQAEGPFVAALGRLFAVAENYPELKANQNFLQLQATLSDTEDRIQSSRRIYNDTVQGFNRRVQAFPSNLIAGWFHFQSAQFFSIPDAQRATVAEAPRVDFSNITQTPPAAPSAPAPAAPDAPGPGAPTAS